MIQKLKSCCGYSYTNKLQRMLQDIRISEDLRGKFQAETGDKNFLKVSTQFAFIVKENAIVRNISFKIISAYKISIWDIFGRFCVNFVSHFRTFFIFTSGYVPKMC